MAERSQHFYNSTRLLSTNTHSNKLLAICSSQFSAPFGVYSQTYGDRYRSTFECEHLGQVFALCRAHRFEQNYIQLRRPHTYDTTKACRLYSRKKEEEEIEEATNFGRLFGIAVGFGSWYHTSLHDIRTQLLNGLASGLFRTDSTILYTHTTPLNKNISLVWGPAAQNAPPRSFDFNTHPTRQWQTSDSNI